MSRDVAIRPYVAADRAAVRAICCDTAVLGGPLERMFGDREVFADFFTRYYTDWEPESALVAEAGGRVIGYMTGCVRYRLYPLVQYGLIVPRALLKMLAHILVGRYTRRDFRFLWWFVARAGRETPVSVPRAAHAHVNLLPEWRDGRAGRGLIFTFLRDLERRGVERVYGHFRTYEDRRTERMFERYGFKVLDRREVTKFREFSDERAFVSTVYKELTHKA